jgi:hypothetical protein
MWCLTIVLLKVKLVAEVPCTITGCALAHVIFSIRQLLNVDIPEYV